MLYTDNDKIIEGKREKATLQTRICKRYTSIPKLYRKLFSYKNKFLKSTFRNIRKFREKYNI